VIALVLAASAAAAGIVGWLWWRGDGRMQPGSRERVLASEVSLPDAAFGLAATLLLFGSQQDGRTDVVRHRLEALIDGRPGVRIAEVDLTTRGDLAGRYAVTRTPTLLVLDADGRLTARVKGAADTDVLRAALDTAERGSG
jgi:hypothetical protein